MFVDWFNLFNALPSIRHLFAARLSCVNQISVKKSEKRVTMHFSANPRGFLRSLLRHDYGGGAAGVSSCSYRVWWVCESLW